MRATSVRSWHALDQLNHHRADTGRLDNWGSRLSLAVCGFLRSRTALLEFTSNDMVSLGGCMMNNLMNETTIYFLELWQDASLTDYAGLVLTIVILGWFVSRYGRKVGT